MLHTEIQEYAAWEKLVGEPGNEAVSKIKAVKLMYTVLKPVLGSNPAQDSITNVDRAN